MSEDEYKKAANRDEETDEVEGHLHGRRIGAADEGSTEGEDDDFEAHVKRESPKKA